MKPNADTPDDHRQTDRTATTSASASATPEPRSSGTIGLDLEKLRLSQDFAADLGVKKVITTVPVRKPPRQSFVRVRAGEEWRFETLLLEAQDERESYLVDPSLRTTLMSELVPKVLVTGIDRQGVVFMWPIRLPGPDDRLDSWNRSAREAAELAQSKWVSVRSNMTLAAYEVYPARNTPPDPEWPDLTLEQLLNIAFKNHFIDSIDHPIVRRILGNA